MEIHDNFETSEDSEVGEQPSILHSVTPLSKYLAMILFIIMPFVGGYIGYKLAPEKVVEVEKFIFEDSSIDKQEVSSVDFDDQAEFTLSNEHFFVDQGAYSIRKNGDVLEIVHDGNVTQTIGWDTTAFNWFTRKDQYILDGVALNRDNIDDVGLLVAVGSGGKNLFYNFYRYNESSRQLELIEELNWGEQGIPNPGWGYERQIIAEFYIDENTSEKRIYVLDWESGKYRLTEFPSEPKDEDVVVGFERPDGWKVYALPAKEGDETIEYEQTITEITLLDNRIVYIHEDGIDPTQVRLKKYKQSAESATQELSDQNSIVEQISLDDVVVTKIVTPFDRNDCSTVTYVHTFDETTSVGVGVSGVCPSHPEGYDAQKISVAESVRVQ